MNAFISLSLISKKRLSLLQTQTRFRNQGKEINVFIILYNKLLKAKFHYAIQVAVLVADLVADP